MRSLLKFYRGSLVAASLVFVLIGALMGPFALIPLAILVVLEISFSFDNAVVNAKVLRRMSEKWQTIFMTLGIAVAVVGMRGVFPVLIVSLTAHLGFGSVVHLAFANPHLYGVKLAAAHPEIAMFGGVFLAMIFLDFLLEDREVMWLRPIEEFFAKIGRTGKLDTLSILLVLTTVLGISLTAGHGLSLLIAGVASLGAYILVDLIANVFDDEDDDNNESGTQTVRTGLAAFALFLYLEAQDASFSFDGVSGAFAITDKVVLIAAGLGVGAIFVRSMTVHLVRTDKLGEYRYLEHGAHWAICVLALCLLASIYHDISQYITGLIGVVFIGASFWHSILANKRDRQEVGKAA